MSRGLGRTQRAILALLEKTDRIGSAMIARRISGMDMYAPWAPPPGVEASVCRALRTLHHRGLIERVPTWWGHGWALKGARQANSRGADDELWSALEQGRTSSADRRKLGKILGMLGSAHEGERAAALVKAEELRRQIGKSWEELLS